MAVTTLTVIDGVKDTFSADQTATPGTQIVTGADGGSIAISNRTDKLALLVTDGGAGDTVVVTAGDNPPALRAGLGALSQAFAASDVRWVVIDAARFMQDDGTILITCTGDANITVAPFRIPATV